MAWPLGSRTLRRFWVGVERCTWSPGSRWWFPGGRLPLSGLEAASSCGRSRRPDNYTGVIYQGVASDALICHSSDMKCSGLAAVVVGFLLASRLAGCGGAAKGPVTKESLPASALPITLAPDPTVVLGPGCEGPSTSVDPSVRVGCGGLHPSPLSSSTTLAVTSPTESATSTTVGWRPLTLGEVDELLREVEHHNGEAYRILGKIRRVSELGLNELARSAEGRQLEVETDGYRRAYPNEFTGGFSDRNFGVTTIFDQTPTCISLEVDNYPGRQNSGPPEPAALEVLHRTDRWRVRLFIPATVRPLDKKGIPCGDLFG